MPISSVVNETNIIIQKRKAVPLDSRVSKRPAISWRWFQQIKLFLSHTCYLKLVSPGSESETWNTKLRAKTLATNYMTKIKWKLM